MVGFKIHHGGRYMLLLDILTSIPGYFISPAEYDVVEGVRSDYFGKHFLVVHFTFFKVWQTIYFLKNFFKEIILSSLQICSQNG